MEIELKKYIFGIPKTNSFIAETVDGTPAF